MMTFMVRSPGKLNVWNGMLCSFNMRCASLKMEGFAVCMRMLLSDEILAIIESELMVLRFLERSFANRWILVLWEEVLECVELVRTVP